MLRAALQISNRLVIPARSRGNDSRKMMSLLCNDFEFVSNFTLLIRCLSFYVRFPLQPKLPEAPRRMVATLRTSFATRMTSAKMRWRPSRWTEARCYWSNKKASCRQSETNVPTMERCYRRERWARAECAVLGTEHASTSKRVISRTFRVRIPCRASRSPWNKAG